MLELLAAALISVMIGTVLLVVSGTASDVMASVNGEGTLQMRLTNAMVSLGQDIRLASSVSGGGSSLTLTLPAIDANTQVIADAFDTITYSLAPDLPLTTYLLQRTVNADPRSRRKGEPARVVARDVQSAAFDVTVAPVTATLTASRTEGRRPYSLTLTARMALRNE